MAGTLVGPTHRWTPLRYHPKQFAYFHSPARFNVLPAGRRSGKTENAKRKLVKRAFLGGPDARFFIGAPTWRQVKDIYWTDIKALVPKKFLATRPYESDLWLKLVHGPEIRLIGMDKPERFEGQPWDGGVLDEYANMREEAWPNHVRPALADRLGWCDFIGVPEGRNHYYDLYNQARSDPTGEWRVFTWHSADILPKSEIEALRRELDALTFQQEMEASFVDFQGRAYWPFLFEKHCSLALRYDPRAALILCFDFNVSPGSAVVCQEQQLPNGYIGTGVIGQVHIPRASDTIKVCSRLLQDWGTHEGEVWCYGDATGGAGGSAKVMGSDWDLIRGKLRPHFGNRLKFDVPVHNPRERARVNSLNSRLETVDGHVRLMVDPRQAPAVVKDLEGVTVVQGGSGELDKKSDPKLTHWTDGLGYYVHRRFPLPGDTATVEKLPI